MKAPILRRALRRAAVVLCIATVICAYGVIALARHGSNRMGEAMELYLLAIGFGLGGVAALILSFVVRPPDPPRPAAPGEAANGS